MSDFDRQDKIDNLHNRGERESAPDIVPLLPKISKSPDLDQSKFVSISLDDIVHATCALIKVSS